MYPPEGTWDQSPPLWTDKQTENITFPHPSDTGGKYVGSMWAILREQAISSIMCSQIIFFQVIFMHSHPLKRSWKSTMHLVFFKLRPRQFTRVLLQVHYPFRKRTSTYLRLFVLSTWSAISCKFSAILLVFKSPTMCFIKASCRKRKQSTLNMNTQQKKVLHSNLWDSYRWKYLSYPIIDL